MLKLVKECTIWAPAGKVGQTERRASTEVLRQEDAQNSIRGKEMIVRS